MSQSKTGVRSTPRVVVTGGGATGFGVARDLAMRGFSVTLVEFGDLGSGTSSRFHGMLQSGARYAVSDSDYAAECMRERLIIADLAPGVVEKTGGLFVSLPDDPPEFANKFINGCQIARIPVQELDPEQVMAEEPNISRHVQRAFSVPDATIQSWRLVNLLADDVRLRGGRILIRQPAVELLRLIPGIELELSQADCCGIGGTYGYVKNKYDIAMSVGKIYLIKHSISNPMSSSVTAKHVVGILRIKHLLKPYTPCNYSCDP